MSQHALSPFRQETFLNETGATTGAFDRGSTGEGEGRYFRPLGLSNRLTLSFAPDDTSIFRHQSSFYESFGHLLTAQELEDTILRAFKTWTREGNLDVGFVEDSGDAFGVVGRSWGDERFGDVRIGAYPMAQDVYAIALSQGDFVSGTWAGDILFNASATFEDAEQFFAVALHEAGHALGLEHSDNPNSVMHPHSTRTQLSRNDIKEFRNLYGIRQLDSYDDEHGNNNSINTATELELDDELGEPGLYPSIVFGDITNQDDPDYYRFEPPGNYSGPLSLKVISSGISLLAPKISVLDEQGQFVIGDVSTSSRGDELTLTFPAMQFGDKFFIRVEGLSSSDFGSYSLITTLDDRLIVDDQTIRRVATNSEFTFMEQEDIARYLANPTAYLFNDDGHSDDDHSSSNPLESEDGYELYSRYRYNASLLDGSDIDVYSIQSPSFDSSGPPLTLNISLRAVELGGMVPKASVLDENENLIPSRVIVNGLGEYVLQLDAIQDETNYFIHVEADDLLPFSNGNYEMIVSYTDQPVRFDEFASGRVGSATDGSMHGNKQYHSLHVAESQMFQFAFEADALANEEDALLWLTIYNTKGEILYQAATRDGERRTAQAAYFSPGSYTVEIEIASPTGNRNRARQNINYRLLGIDIGDPQGPVFNDPTHSPFEQNNEGEYEYPDGVISDGTFVFVDGISSNQPMPPRDLPPIDLYYWYWDLGI